MVNIIKDEDIINHIGEYDITLLGANLHGYMREGIMLDIRQIYPYVHIANLNTKYNDPDKLGTILECKEENKPTFILCFMYRHNTKKQLIKDTVDYESYEKCLKLISILYKDKKIAAPLFGIHPFDGNGDKDRILELFQKIFTDVDIDLYDYKQLTIKERWFTSYFYGKTLSGATKDEYYSYINKSKEVFKSHFEKVKKAPKKRK